MQSSNKEKSQKSQKNDLACMRQVAALVRQLRRAHDVETVHDLRVAIRRCRSLASLMEEIDGHESWRDVRRRTRRLFRALGALRELHVHAERLTGLMRSSAVRAHLLDALKHAERAPGRVLRREREAFKLREWKRLRHVLRGRLVVRPGGLLARSLIADRHQRLRQLHRHAAATGSVEAWHALRVGLKRFRYALEAVWPERSVSLRDHLERLQQLLGSLHDLDVLDAWLGRQQRSSNVVAVRRALRGERSRCMREYASAFGRPVATFREWGRGLPRTHVAAGSRIRAMATCMDVRRRHTAAVVRASGQLLRGLDEVNVLPDGPADDIRRLLRTAALLDDIAPAGRSSARRKQARKALLAMPAPGGWRPEDWSIVAAVIGDRDESDFKALRSRFEEPPSQSRQRQLLVVALLRVSRALARNRITALRIERSRRSVVFHVIAPNRQQSLRACAAVARHSRLFALLSGVVVRVVPGTRQHVKNGRQAQRSAGERQPVA